MARNGNAKTRRFALNMLKAGVAIFGAALLFACGDDDSSFVASENGGSAAEADIVVTIFDDLPNCTGKREGVTAYVKDEKTAYVCSDGDWVADSETGDDSDGDDDGEKSSSSTAKSADSKGKSSSSDKDVSSSSVSLSSSSSVTLSEVEGSSSSSVIAGSDPESGSSDKEVSSSSVSQSSSSSVTLSEVEGSSSSSVIPGSDPESSSSDKEVSSSSVTQSSSSSVTLSEVEGSSSSNVIPGSDPESSSSRGFFDMTKDEFLNPKVSYGEMTDKRDYRKYKTVKIGTQVWMAENLNYDYNTGTARSYCYRDKEVNCAVTGRLYTWAAAIDSVALANDADNPQTCGYGENCTLPTVVQGVCPEGWHLPSYDEWQTLFTAVGGKDKAGTALKSQTGWYSQTGDAADRDAYGFSALPAGFRNRNGGFGNASDYAGFWSASEYGIHYAYYMYLYYYYEDACKNYVSKSYGYSVRCLQN